MPARPVKNALHQRLREGRGLPQTALDTSNLNRREVVEFDVASDVEGRHVRLYDEVSGVSDAQQAEGKTEEFWFFGAAVVAGADSDEEFIGLKRQGAHVVNLVNEDDEVLVRACPQCVRQPLCPALQRRQVVMFVPEGFEFVSKVDTIAKPY